MAYSQATYTRANQICAILLPLLQIGAIGYATYVVTVQLCLNYLLSPSSQLKELGVSPRHGTGIAILIIYFILLLLLALAFLRLTLAIWVNPGFIPQGRKDDEKEAFSTREWDRLDAYICNGNGEPIFCQKCHSYKPDRTHHASAIGQCVRRMDHYCPYAGGIISETTHKFFIQFLFWTASYTFFTLAVAAVYVAERKRKNHLPASYIAVLALGAFYFLFSFGMWTTSVYHMAQNLTTVEMVDKPIHIYNIAIRLRSRTRSTSLSHPSSPDSASQAQTLTQEQLARSSHPVLCQVTRGSHSYAIVQTHPGENPWNRGLRENIGSVMGDRIIDWILPLRMSPCTQHKSTRGHYKWAPFVDKLIAELGNDGRRPRTSRSSVSRKDTRTVAEQ